MPLALAVAEKNLSVVAAWNNVVVATVRWPRYFMLGIAFTNRATDFVASFSHINNQHCYTK
jgi:hypothetical protein